MILMLDDAINDTAPEWGSGDDFDVDDGEILGAVSKELEHNKL